MRKSIPSGFGAGIMVEWGMDDQRQRNRRRRSPAEAAQVLSEFEVSGLSQLEFCRRQGLSLSTLSRYVKQGRDSNLSTTPGGRWVAVEVTGTKLGADSGLSVVLPGKRRIEVGRGFDAPTLVQLLDVLERG